MPRVYELRDLIEDPNAPCAYFQDFDDTVRIEPLKQQVWLGREREFSRLDRDSWEFLKTEALPYLKSRHTSRGWPQLISVLNQARAHNFLVDEGCHSVRFIPRARTKGVETPDIEATKGQTKILCEVKTVHISDAEASHRSTRSVRSITSWLEAGFFNKLTSDLLKAKRQMNSFDASSGTRCIAFVVPYFDDFLAEYKASYFGQIDEFLASNPSPGIEVVFYNERTAFHSQVTLKHATVVNESAG